MTTDDADRARRREWLLLTRASGRPRLRAEQRQRDDRDARVGGTRAHPAEDDGVEQEPAAVPELG